ncbi:MAG: beta-eliminating lyase-related protein [bacterium]|nr:beta-eliminating lyase-related protein [bacterium]
MAGQKQNTSKSSSQGLSDHYNASQLRVDTWNQLKHAATRLHEDHRNGRDDVRLREKVDDFFEILTPIESYWAFPGRELLRQLYELYEQREYHLLSGAVTHTVRMLVSESYRSGNVHTGERGDSYFSKVDTRKESASKARYFEVLFVDALSAAEEQALRMRMLKAGSGDEDFRYDVVVAHSFEDALIAVLFNHHIQSCVIRYGFPMRSGDTLEILSRYVSTLGQDVEDMTEAELGPALGKMIKQIRPELDLFLVTDSAVEDVTTQVHQNFRRVFYRHEDYLELHLSIRRGIVERFETPFFEALKAYSQRPTGVFHAMPISRGNSVFKSHWIQDMEQFYGRNIFLAETSATSVGLDSLLQPTGPLKKAQTMAARAFGAQHTFFVTNGTSTANKIVLQGLIRPEDIVLIDRDCHKSNHYGQVLSGSFPVYLDSYPLEAYSIYGAVPLTEIKRQLLALKRAGRLDRVKMLVLTNCTFDGLVYNVERVMEEVLAIKPDMIFMWDEAWFGFARFAPLYRQRTAMYAAAKLYGKYRSQAYRKTYTAYKKTFDKLDPDDEATWINRRLMPDPDQVKIRTYACQSTHKKLSSLRQGAMIHVFDEEFKRKAEDTFHEAYMTHTSTSPNYQILASLDLGRRQAELEGFELVQKSTELAMVLRRKISDHPLLSRYFDVLKIKDLVPESHRASGIEHYYDSGTGWSQMEEAWTSDEFVLDPTHITLFIGKTGIDGDTFKNQYLMDQFGIQVNKTSRNTVLLMTNIGTTRSSVAFLIGVLLKIARQIELHERSMSPGEQKVHKLRVRSLTEDLPPLPDFSAFHSVFRPGPSTSEGDIRRAFFMAYDEASCEYLKLDGSIREELRKDREVVSASFVIPYPPGFPILVPGQVISKEVLDFMSALDVKEIHGYRPDLGLRGFTEASLRREQAKSVPLAAQKVDGNGSQKEVVASPKVARKA